jgi:predicted permease
MTGLARDIFHAWRSLKRAPGFSLVVVLTLGLALGANATMFGIVDRLLLRPPPGITDPARVHRVVVRRWFNGLRNPSAALSFPAFEDIRTGTGSFSQVAAMESATLSYGRGPDARPLRVELVTGAYFAMLGTRPTHGHFFGEGEDRFPDGLPVVVLSHALWRSVFGARPDVLGQAMEISGNRYEIIAVAPPGFSGTELAGAEAWVPLGAGWRTVYSSYDGWRTGRGWQMLQVFGRVKPGVTPEAAADDLRRAYAAGHADYQIYERNAVAQLATLIPGRDPSRRNPAGRVAGWLLGVAVVVLLIACANVANLILARGFGRRTEMAVRQALGVSRGRLIRSLLAESLLLAGLGGLAGILIARWGGALLRGTLLPGITWDRNPVDGRVLVVTAAATIITAVVAGLIPLWRGTRADIASVLHGGSRGISSHSRRLRGTLLLVQTTLCTALLIGAGLFVRSLSRVQGLDIGIEPDRMLRVQIDLAGAGVPPRGILAEHARLLERLRAIPTVEAAGAATSAPFMSNMSQGIRVPGFDSIPRLAGGGPYFFQATAGSLEALGTRLLRGRRITAADERAGAPPVMVVSGRMARTLWPDADPLGKCAFVGDGPCHEVVGVIGDMHRQSLREEPFMLYFVPLSASDTTSTPNVILIRTSGRPERLAETIRREILALRSDLPFINVQPYSEVLDAQSQSWRLGATMFAVFGALSLLMAGVGLYGVLSYAVVQRTRELGIRAALGASPRALVRLVVRSGAAAAAGGVFLGIGIVLLLGRWLQTLLFETSVLDGQALAVAALTVGSVGILASVIPARRATRVTPLEALRSE